MAALPGLSGYHCSTAHQDCAVLRRLAWPFWWAVILGDLADPGLLAWPCFPGHLAPRPVLPQTQGPPFQCDQPRQVSSAA